MEDTNPNPIDSLDIVEMMMAVEEAIDKDPSLSPNQREKLLREIQARIERGEIGDWPDLDAGALGALVRKLGPRGPVGRAGAAVKPEEPYIE